MMSIIKRRVQTIEQFEDELARAKSRYADADAALGVAEEAFDDAGDDASMKALGAAREARQLAKDHRDRAERLLDRAKDQRAKEEQAEIERQIAGIRAELNDASVHEKLLEAEVAAWLAVADARLARRKALVAREARERSLIQLQSKLGVEPTASSFANLTGPNPSFLDVADRLRGAQSDLSPRGNVLRALADAAMSVRC